MATHRLCGTILVVVLMVWILRRAVVVVLIICMIVRPEFLELHRAYLAIMKVVWDTVVPDFHLLRRAVLATLSFCLMLAQWQIHLRLGKMRLLKSLKQEGKSLLRNHRGEKNDKSDSPSPAAQRGGWAVLSEYRLMPSAGARQAGVHDHPLCHIVSYS